MLFMNEYEINAAVDRFSNHPVLSKATKFLAKFRDEVNANSDGWPYWSRPVVSAKKLMTIIMHPEQATEQSLKAAITPIKAFYTRHGAKAGMPFPKGILEEPPASQEELRLALHPNLGTSAIRCRRPHGPRFRRRVHAEGRPARLDRQRRPSPDLTPRPLSSS